MKRTLAATCAALMLTGSLTACSTTAPTDSRTMTGPTGTTYNTAPGGANEDRNVGGARTSSRVNRNTGIYNGRYAAYADGSLAGDPNGGSTMGRDLARDVRDITKGINNAVRDMNRAKQKTYPSGNSGNVGTNVPTAKDINTGLD